MKSVTGSSTTFNRWRNSLWLLVLLLFLNGCSGLPRIDPPPPPEKQYQQAAISGYHNIRYWGDKPPPYFDEIIQHQLEARKINPGLYHRVDLLALSGGGEDGAYGAGLLKGWTARGDRPEFNMVTGVSTGALIAPFAFLGSDYDEVLKHFYTGVNQKNIFLFRPLTGLFGGSALGDSTPLKQLLHQVVDSKLLTAIARESRRGRVLLIGTTNLDAQRPMTWDIGRIAEQDTSRRAVELVINIMLASASVPAAFPPVNFDVTIDGRRYQEMHVDGGVSNQIFAYSPWINTTDLARTLDFGKRKNFWLIRNTKISPEYKAVNKDIFSISTRALKSLLKYQGLSNLMLLVATGERDGLKTHVAYVPENFDIPQKGPFDTDYMNKLYQLGYQAGLSGKAWVTVVKN